MFGAIPHNTPSSVDGNQNNFPGESLLTTREQHKQNVRKESILQQNKRPRLDLSPVVYITADKIQQTLTTRALTVLLDSGSSHTMMKRSSLPHGTKPISTSPRRTTTTNGVFSTNSTITLDSVKFPEFGNHCIPRITADMFDSLTCQYDVILGCDILKLMGVLIDFQTHTINWMGRTVPMKSRKEISHNAVDQCLDSYYNHLDDEADEDFDLLAELYADDIVIMDRKYQAVSPEEVVQQLHHLTKAQKAQLKATFEKYKRSLMVPLASTPRPKSTSNWFQTPNQFINNHIRYHSKESPSLTKSSTT